VSDVIRDERAARVRRYEHGSRVPGWDEAVDLDKPPAQIPDAAVVDVPTDLRREIEDHMANYPDRRSAALPALAAAQRVHGWCSPEAIDQVACVMRLTPAYLASVATFYDMFDTTPVGTHQVYVCTNISCSLRGADDLFDAFLTQAGEDPDFNVRSFECLGACDIAPMASVDGVYLGPLTLDDVPRLLDQARAGGPVLVDKQLVRRPVADPRVNSRDYPIPPPVDAPTGGLGNAIVPDADAEADRGGGPAAVEHSAHDPGEAATHLPDHPDTPDTGTGLGPAGPGGEEE